MASANIWDQAGRFSIRLDPPVFFEWVANLPRNENFFRGWLDTRAVVVPGEEDRVRDTVARMEDVDQHGVPWAVVVEIQSSPHPDILGRMNVYGGLLSQEEKPDPEPGSRYRVGGLVVNLTGRQRDIIQEQFSRTKITSLTPPTIFNLIDQDADVILRRIETGELGLGILLWVPLTYGGEREDIIERWKALGMLETDSERRAHYGGLALLFAEKAGCLDVWKQALKEWNMEESVVVNEWLKQGEARGYAKGEEAGFQKGEQIGIQKGEQIGIQKGEQVGLIGALTVALQLKFGEEGLTFADELSKTNNLEALRLVQQSLLDVTTLDELRKIISNQT
ncbi:MAG: hypothetical protein ACFCD0_05015 [Gemmataceae bacterium]